MSYYQYITLFHNKFKNYKRMAHYITGAAIGEWLIPDNNAAGISSPITMTLRVLVESLMVHVDIEHPFVGDLQVNLIAPSGKTVHLHNREGFTANNIVKTYEGGVLDELKGESLTGEWSLQAIDFAANDVGKINSWSLEAAYNIVQPTVTAMETTIETVVPTTVIIVAEAATETKKEDTEDQKDADGAEADNEETKKSEDDDDDDDDSVDDDDDTDDDFDDDDEWEEDEEDEDWDEDEAEDDLQTIEGIGVKIKELLNEAGIFSFAQIAESKPDDLKMILRRAGPQFNRHNTETWVQQAQLAAEGKWAELNALQEGLIGGRLSHS
jgi:subtilisin-like proprotein convertase family protein